MTAATHQSTAAVATLFATTDHDLRGAGAARRAVLRWLEARGICGDALERTELVCSELVTNALRCTDGLVEVRLDEADGDIVIEVFDESRRQPIVVDAGLEDTHGRGLALVAALADEWGTRRGTDRTGSGDVAGKVVWAHITRD